MTPLTESQEKFLRELTKKLGWVSHHEYFNPDVYVIDKSTHELRRLSWLVTPDGRDYLVNRAQEEGYTYFQCDWFGSMPWFKGDKPYKVCLACHPRFHAEGNLTGWVCATANSEPWATALAVAKALFGLEMET